MKKEYKERRPAKHAAQAEAKKKITSSGLSPGDVMEFFRQCRTAKTESGLELKSQASELIQSGWDGIGYMMVATAPELVRGQSGIGRKRCVFATQGEDAVLEFQGWYRERISETWAAGWRYYLSSKRCTMADDEFKGQIVYRNVGDKGSVLVEFIPWITFPQGSGITEKDFRSSAQLLTDEMRVQDVAEIYLLALKTGARLAWIVGGEG